MPRCIQHFATGLLLATDSASSIMHRLIFFVLIPVRIVVSWEPRVARGAEGAARLSGSALAPISPTEAPGRMTVPEGFTVTLFAAEPDVVQPVALTIDPKGRLWVVENYSYPIWLAGPQGKDRILIFEDADGDGRFHRRRVSTTRERISLESNWASAGPGCARPPT
jgi:hypothetical protein